MKLRILIISALLCTSFAANAAEKMPGIKAPDTDAEDFQNPVCPDINKLESCIPLGQGTFDDIKKYKLNENIELVTVHDKDASGAFNPYTWAFLLNKNTKELIDISSQNGGLVNVAVDTKNLVLSSTTKATPDGSTGGVEFFKIDVVKSQLAPLQEFHTDTDGTNYFDESNQKDAAGGYMPRAKAYAKKSGYNLDISGSNTK